uniref:TAZ-type domain-containing protein n=1 Tax=Aegilops tauschii subsp. strangulata TaxID=200361 RepID=A0A453G8C8_AEGTS
RGFVPLKSLQISSICRIRSCGSIDVMWAVGHVCWRLRCHFGRWRDDAFQSAAKDRWPANLDVSVRRAPGKMRRRKWRRKRAEQKVYVELSDAMDILRHICTEGCTEVGPVGQAPAKSPCPAYATCRGLQLLIRHFSRCKSRATCPRCQRMWQLLRLHAALCRVPDGHCNTPLCTQFKLKEQQKEAMSASVAAKAGDGRWGLLVKKVKAVSVMSSLGKRSSPSQCC